MRTFTLVRHRDISGVSGTGIVGEGCVFHDGQAVLSWFGRFHSISIHPNIDEVFAIHGHNGTTTIEWDDGGSNG